MAYAVVDSLNHTIPRILSEDEQYPISDEGKQLIELLSKDIALLRGFLEGTKEEGMSLETRIRDAANRAEDVMEHLMYEHLRYKTVVGTDIILYDFRELKNAMEEINSIAEEVEIVQQQQQGGLPAAQSKTRLSLEIEAPIVNTVTVGLDEHVKKIRDLLCGGSSANQIIPITGMGGIGKTTLARAVYQNEEVVQTFPTRVWIVVSQNYQTENIFEMLLYSLMKQVDKRLVDDDDTMENKLHRVMTLKKFLIVVDDLWSPKAWDDLRKGFGHPRKRDGSRIIITTRIKEMVNSTHHAIYSYTLPLLDDHQSWCLLKQKVFPCHKECPSELVKIGKDIAKGCKGLPLAIVVVAAKLSQRKQTQSSWEEVAQNLRSFIVEDPLFRERMLLSYTHLPCNLRPCFLYMCGFPEDYEIRVSMLSKLFMAEGFVENEMEAEQYLIYLERQNLVFIKATKSNGKIKSYTLHGLMRDLSNIKALDENYERRLNNSHLDLREVARAYTSTMRSVISFQRNESSLRGLRKFKLLRVLDVVDTDAYALPASVFDLFHLRYLAFGCPMEVPSAISRLQKLRALIIRPSKRSRKYRYSTDEVCLPLEIWMMPLLTHLVSFFDLFPNPEGAASALKNLLTLSVVKKLICTEEMMKLICNVKKLSVTYFGDMYKEDYQLNNLVLLTQLEKLTLAVKKGSHFQIKAKPVFPETLKKLTLSGWRFPWENMKSIAALPHLQVLKLRDHAFEGNTWSTLEESDEEDEDEDYEEAEVKLFLELEYLLIEESDLENWVTNNRHFPALERLVLKGCDKLNEIPNDIRYTKLLKIIEVDRANLSLLKCIREIQKELIEYDTALEVREL
ncbi:putative late blight resistance protein homolog R1B-14 [Salvia hispanica]|uniref:putative late blight resistance protein homolog R1B-14 n=1 Tax=Salvia hispanica TaxID=49212 RepID=UPI002008FAB0|nr:putative late blight resistance protein homolog R1B-14 [Salvia hispanica]